MKKQLRTELFFFIGTLIIATVIYISLLGISSFKNNSLEIAIHDNYFVFWTFLVVGQFWIITYFLANVVRQSWLKFYNIFANTMLILSAGLLFYFIYNLIELLNDPGMTLNENSLTLYPPLSGIPQTIKNDRSGLNSIKTVLWTIEVIILTTITLTIGMTFYRRKRH